MVEHWTLYQLDIRVTQISLSFSRSHNSRGMLLKRLSKTTGSDSCALCQLIIKERKRNDKSACSKHVAPENMLIGKKTEEKKRSRVD